MAKNDITGDRLVSKANTDAFRSGHALIFGKKPPYQCRFCGAPSWVDPNDQTPPPDYCHESDHGEPE